MNMLDLEGAGVTISNKQIIKEFCLAENVKHWLPIIVACRIILGIEINSESLEDTQDEYISQKYT